MIEPKIAGKMPLSVNLEQGKKYYWCSCGESTNQPFCDGSHKTANNFKSIALEVETTGQHWLCACKKTANPPFCDGSHKNC